MVDALCTTHGQRGPSNMLDTSAQRQYLWIAYVPVCLR